MPRYRFCALLDGAHGRGGRGGLRGDTAADLRLGRHSGDEGKGERRKSPAGLTAQCCLPIFFASVACQSTGCYIFFANFNFSFYMGVDALVFTEVKYVTVMFINGNKYKC